MPSIATPAQFEEHEKMLLALQSFVSPRISWMFDKSEFDKFMNSIDEKDDCGYDKNKTAKNTCVLH